MKGYWTLVFRYAFKMIFIFIVPDDIELYIEGGEDEFGRFEEDMYSVEEGGTLFKYCNCFNAQHPLIGTYVTYYYIVLYQKCFF